MSNFINGFTIGINVGAIVIIALRLIKNKYIK